MKEDEEVLVYPVESFDDSVTSDNVIERLTTLPGGQFMPRSRAETDLDYVQVIPYILVYQRGYTLFKRSSKSGESRLSGCVTLGVGGHINRGDAICPETGLLDVSFRSAYYRGASRELREELGASVANFAEYDDWRWHRCVGLIRLRDTPVNSVHVGLVHVLRLPDDLPIVCDDSLSLYPLSLHRQRLACGEVSGLNLESWSRYLLDSGVVDYPLLRSFLS